MGSKKLYSDFWQHRGSEPLPTLFKGQLYLLFFMQRKWYLLTVKNQSKITEAFTIVTKQYTCYQPWYVKEAYFRVTRWGQAVSGSGER